MRARLLCRTGALSGSTHALAHDTIIGRSATEGVVVPLDLVSSRHARITQDPRGFVLEDLESANGTWLDGERVREPVRLDHLNVINLARTVDFIFQVEADVAMPVQSKPQAPPAVEVRETQFYGDAFGALPVLQNETPIPLHVGRSQTIPVGGSTTFAEFGHIELPTLETEEPAPYSLVISGPRWPEKTCELKGNRRYTLGRSIECDVQIDEVEVSRHHATIDVGARVMVEDAGSSNGTRLDGRRLLEVTEFLPGSTIALGVNVTAKLVRR